MAQPGVCAPSGHDSTALQYTLHAYLRDGEGLARHQ